MTSLDEISSDIKNQDTEPNSERGDESLANASSSGKGRCTMYAQILLLIFKISIYF